MGQKAESSPPQSYRGLLLKDNGAHFSIYSEAATKIEFCLFDDQGNKELSSIELTRGKDHVWEGFIPDVKPGQIYGLRVHGPDEPHNGHRFTPNLIMLDPHAHEVVMNAKEQTAPIMARAVDRNYDWGDVAKPNHSFSNTIIYEAHAKGLTKEMPGVPSELQGTIAGLGSDAAIDHLKELGINAIELLPLHAFFDAHPDEQSDLANYWGYNSAGFFAPHPRYLNSGSINELKDTIKKLHQSGIEVILDVVFNHTAEGGSTGPTLSFKGIDNKTYYRLKDDDLSDYVDETGCGNTLNITHPEVLNMVISSLKYWAKEFQIDGFRFDLAVSLGRNPEYFDACAPFFKAIENDPDLSKLKMIAEPWDLGPGGYQVGNFPKPFHEWSDLFRDHVRRFWKGDQGMLGSFAQRLSGSSQEFRHSGHTDVKTVNKISAHDGFTLKDVVSYEQKHNEANGENNADGHNANYSCNYGVEGPTQDQAINELRLKQQKNMLASLFLAQGAPMLLAGDEMGNSQQGNNNAYCQDNEVGWVNWEENSDLKEFVKELINIRKQNPILNESSYLNGQRECGDGIKDLSWYNQYGSEMEGHQWYDMHRRSLAALFNNAAVETDHNPGTKLLTIFNAGAQQEDFVLPELANGSVWEKILDTDLNNKNNDLNVDQGSHITLPERSTQIYVQKPI